MVDDTNISLWSVILFSFLQVVSCRECYNYKDEPVLRDCEHGCCGEQYEEYCCNVTLQIIGSTIGALIVVSAVIAVAYCCYKKKTKRSQGGLTGGLLGRLGMRSNPHHRRQGAQQRQVRHRNLPHQQVEQITNITPNYMQRLPGHPQGVELYPQPVPGQPMPLAPTAPMPPPYSINPPPYVSKGPPPPPSYSAVVGHMGTVGYKYDSYDDTLPPPSS